MAQEFELFSGFEVCDAKARKNIEIINNGYINVKLHGVIGDGVTDDTQAIQECINNFQGYTLYFPVGTYAISSPLIIKRANADTVNLKLELNAKIIALNEIDSLLEIGYDNSTGEQARGGFPLVSCIDGGTWECSNVNYGIKINPLKKLIEIKNAQFVNIKNCGVLSDYGPDTYPKPGNMWIDKCAFRSIKTNSSDNEIGIYVKSTDNTFSNITIDNCKKPILCEGWGNNFTNIHATAWFDSSATDDDKNNCIAFDFENTGSWNTCIDCYADTYGIGFKSNGGILYLTACKCYWYQSDENSRFKCVSVTNFNENTTKLNLINCDFELPKNGTNRHIDTTTSGYLFNNNFSFVNCRFNYNSSTDIAVYRDPAFSVPANNLNAINCDRHDKTEMIADANVFYPIAVI